MENCCLRFSIAFLIFSMQQTDPEVKKKPHKSKFTQSEDDLLKNAVQQYGTYDWRKISECLPNRNPRQCRDRWNKYLKPERQNDGWTAEEDSLLIDKFNEFGSKWDCIATFFPNKTVNSIKTRWKKREKDIQMKVCLHDQFGVLQYYGYAPNLGLGLHNVSKFEHEFIQSQNIRNLF